jgi:hypothetical protein
MFTAVVRARAVQLLKIAVNLGAQGSLGARDGRTQPLRLWRPPAALLARRAAAPPSSFVPLRSAPTSLLSLPLPARRSRTSAWCAPRTAPRSPWIVARSRASGAPRWLGWRARPRRRWGKATVLGSKRSAQAAWHKACAPRPQQAQPRAPQPAPAGSTHPAHAAGKRFGARSRPPHSHVAPALRRRPPFPSPKVPPAAARGQARRQEAAARLQGARQRRRRH